MIYLSDLLIKTLCTIIFSFMIPYGFGQQSPDKQCCNKANKSIYDSKNIIAVNGEIMQVILVKSRRPEKKGIHLILKSDKKDTIEIHLGPKHYIDEQKFTLKENDKIKVLGSKVIMNQKEVIIAREIEKENQLLRLRDENGAPLWSRGNR